LLLALLEWEIAELDVSDLPPIFHWPYVCGEWV
jgi:hypothetical protein